MNTAQYAMPDLYSLLHGVGIALVLGAILGYDRERKDKPAGIRTHALVSVASCLAMMAAVGMDGADGNDGVRGLGAIMTGIGFLGAGAIMRRGETVHGIKTGATIWTAGAVGVSVGLGWPIGGLVVAGAVVVILTILTVIKRRLPADTQAIALQMKVKRDEPFPLVLIEDLREMRFEVISVTVDEPEDGEVSEAEIVIESPADFAPEVAASVAQGSDLVTDVRYEVTPNR